MFNLSWLFIKTWCCSSFNSVGLDLLFLISSVIEKQDENGDDFDRFKAPYQAAECLCCLPAKNINILLENECVIDTLFDLMDNKIMMKTFVIIVC